MEPEDLARRLDISGKKLRDWLRRRYPRGAVDSGARWDLTPDQVAEASRHFEVGTSEVRVAGPVSRVEVSTPELTEAATGASAARTAGAAKYWPKSVRLLLVAEAPPMSDERYFYFEDVAEQDSLFRYVIRGLFREVPTRQDKTRWLARLRDAGVALVDVSADPRGASDLVSHVPECVERCRAIAPEAIVLIKATVYDAMFAPLRSAGLPVVNRRIPFPGSGQQARFEAAFAEALDLAGWKRSG